MKVVQITMKFTVTDCAYRTLRQLVAASITLSDITKSVSFGFGFHSFLRALTLFGCLAHEKTIEKKILSRYINRRHDVIIYISVYFILSTKSNNVRYTV